MSEVVIKYDGEDITADCVVSECWFIARANGFAGEAQVVVRDDAQIKSFVPGKTLELFIDGRREWDGYAVQRRFNYWFEGHTANCYPCPHITPRKHVLLGADRNILFERRVLYNKAAPAEPKDNTWPAGAIDEDVIEESIALYLDDIDGIDFTTKVEEVAAVDPYAEIRVPGPSSMFGALMREVSQATGAVFFIDPDRYLVYTDVNSPDAPFVLTDKPLVEGEVGYREMVITSDASNMVNDALVWGAGGGSPNIVFARLDDATSLDLHGRWQNTGGYRTGVWTQGSVDRIADSIVYGSPSNKRGHKDDQVTVELATFTPGLRVAQKVEFHSEAHVFTDVIPVRTIRMSFPKPDAVRYEVRLSHELDEPWSIFEPWRPDRIGRDPRGDPPTQCTIPNALTPSGIVLKTGQTHLDLGLKGSHTVQRGTISDFVSIQSDGFPANKWTFIGNNEFESVSGGSGTGGNPSVAYDYQFADKYWYGNGSGDLQVPGPRILRWVNAYSGYVANANTVNPNYPVRAKIEVSLTMAGTMSDRDVTGQLFPIPGVGRNGTVPAPTHHVLFGLLQPEKNYKEPHTNPAPLWEGDMASGDTVNFTAFLAMPSRNYFMLGVDFLEIPPGTKPWLTNVRVTTGVTITYTNELPLTVGVGPDADGLPCIEVGDLGRTCMDAIHVAGNTYRILPYAPRTTRVSVDGLTLAGSGIEYTESSPERGEITLVNEPTGEVYVCFDVSYYSRGLPDQEALFIVPTSGRITGTFGSQYEGWPSAYWNGSYYEHFHNGVDFGVVTGTPVYAAADGTVKYETQAAGGTMIHIYHPFHGFRTTYAHLSQRLVADGATVIQGQIIAYSGDSGTVTGPHLHWGLVYMGSPQDPLPYSNYSKQVLF